MFEYRKNHKLDKICMNEQCETETLIIDDEKYINMLLWKGISQSFNIFTAWKSACCRLDLDQCRYMQCCSSNKCK